MYDIIIIGAGPAGVSAAIYGVSRGKSTLMIEKEKVGGLIGRVSTVTHYSALVEPETGESFATRLKSQAERAGAKIVYETVTGVSLSGDVKTVTTDGNTYQGKTVILANGTVSRKLGIPGETELWGRGIGMNAARDGQKYAGKQVYVVGGADGAIKEALYLAGLAEKVTVIHFEDQLGTIAEFKNRVEASENIQVRLHTRLTAVSGDGQVERLELTDVKTGKTEVVEDPGCGIFVYAGSTPATELYGELELKDGYIPVNERQETALPGVYAAGDICVKQVRQVATAVADGAIAAIHAAAAC